MQLYLTDPAFPYPPCSLLLVQRLLSSLYPLSSLRGVYLSLHCIDGVVTIRDHLATFAIDAYLPRWVSPSCPICPRVPIVANLCEVLCVATFHVPLLNCTQVMCMVALVWYSFFCLCWFSSGIYVVHFGELFGPFLNWSWASYVSFV